MMESIQAYVAVFSGILQIFLVTLAGLFFFRSGMVSRETIGSFSSLTINLFLPCMMFSHLIKNFSREIPAFWWFFPLLGILISVAGFLLSRVMLFFLPKQRSNQADFESLITFQNSGYLPLVLVFTIYPEPIAEVLFTYIFLFLQGYNLLFFSLGLYLFSPGKKTVFDLKKLINTPFIVLVLSFIIVGLKAERFIPKAVIEVANMVGGCTLPVSLLILGGILSECLELKNLLNKKFLGLVVIGKMLVLPLLALLLIMVFPMPRLIALLILIQSAMPAAINLGVISYNENSRCSLISQGVLATHIFGIITIPFFVVIFSLLF